VLVDDVMTSGATFDLFRGDAGAACGWGRSRSRDGTGARGAGCL